VCALHGPVIVTGWSSAPIPWPIGFGERPGRHTPVLTGDLVRAVTTEALCVVAALFGASANTVQRWKKAVGAPAVTPGTAVRQGDANRRSEPWTPAEDALILSLPVKEGARRTGLRAEQVYRRLAELRRAAGVAPPGKRR